MTSASEQLTARNLPSYLDEFKELGYSTWDTLESRKHRAALCVNSFRQLNEGMKKTEIRCIIIPMSMILRQ